MLIEPELSFKIEPKEEKVTLLPESQEQAKKEDVVAENGKISIRRSECLFKLHHLEELLKEKLLINRMMSAATLLRFHERCQASAKK